MHLEIHRTCRKTFSKRIMLDIQNSRVALVFGSSHFILLDGFDAKRCNGEVEHLLVVLGSRPPTPGNEGKASERSWSWSRR